VPLPNLVFFCLVHYISQCVKSKTPLWLMVDVVRFLCFWGSHEGGPLEGPKPKGVFRPQENPMSTGTLHMQEMDSLFLCSIFASLFFFMS